MTDIEHSTVAFVDIRERTVARQALKAMRDVVDLKAELGLPLLPETREAILELEGMVSTLRLTILRSPHAEQPMLPGMGQDLLAAKEDKPDIAS
jgi:hypothetical protein